MIVEIDNNKEESIKKEIEKEYDEIYKKFVKTKGALKRRVSTKKYLKKIILAYFIGLGFLFFTGILELIVTYISLALFITFIYLYHKLSKEADLDNHVNRMLVTRVSKDIEYKAYPFVFDKELFLRINKHLYDPQVDYSKEIVIEDNDKGIVYRNVDIRVYPSMNRMENGMFAYVEIPNANYPRVVIKKTSEEKKPTLDDEDEFKYYFDIAGKGDDFETIKAKILESVFMEKLKVYSRHFHSAKVIVENNIISAFFFNTYNYIDRVSAMNENSEWYSYQFGKEIMENNYNDENIDGSEFFCKTNKNYNRYNYYRWFGPIKIVEELTKIL